MNWWYGLTIVWILWGIVISWIIKVSDPLFLRPLFLSYDDEEESRSYRLGFYIIIILLGFPISIISIIVIIINQLFSKEKTNE